MKKTKEFFKKSNKRDNRYTQLKDVILKEIVFIKEQYIQLKTIGKIVLIIQIIFFIRGSISGIYNLGNIIGKCSFYIKGITYLKKCSDFNYRFYNDEICNSYANTRLGKNIIEPHNKINQEEYIKTNLKYAINYKDVLQQSENFNTYRYKITENDGLLDMKSPAFIDQTLKESGIYENRMSIDGHMRIHTVGDTIEEKNIIFTTYPLCTGNSYNGTFYCEHEYNPKMPIIIKTIYCENGKTIKDIFDKC